MLKLRDPQPVIIRNNPVIINRIESHRLTLNIHLIDPDLIQPEVLFEPDCTLLYSTPLHVPRPFRAHFLVKGRASFIHLSRNLLAVS